MKKSIIAVSAVVVALVTLTSFKPVSAPPKLYPELEAYFKSIPKKDFSTEHVQALENLKSNISFSTMDYSDYMSFSFAVKTPFEARLHKFYFKLYAIQENSKK